MQRDAQIADFLKGDSFAVVGASTNRQKYGNKVLRMYQQHGYNVSPVNPNATVVEGLPAVASLKDLPNVPHAISIITPPEVTENVVAEAIDMGIPHIWMQPGAESADAIRACEQAQVNLIHSGPCILVVVGYSES